MDEIEELYLNLLNNNTIVVNFRTSCEQHNLSFFKSKFSKNINRQHVNTYQEDPNTTKLIFKICVYIRWLKRKKNRNTPTYLNSNYRTKIKLIPIIMDYCLLQFDALQFFLGVRLHRGSLPNFHFFNVNLKIFQRNRKVHLSNYLETDFRDIPNISLRVIRRRNYS